MVIVHRPRCLHFLRFFSVLHLAINRRGNGLYIGDCEFLVAGAGSQVNTKIVREISDTSE